MIITNANSGQKADYSLSGTKLTIENKITIDLQEKERTVERVIDICLDSQLNTIREGLGAWYVANIIIPPRRYSYQSTGKTDENEEDIMEEVALPVDPSLVELRLWGLPVQYFENKEEKLNEDDQEDDE